MTPSRHLTPDQARAWVAEANRQHVDLDRRTDVVALAGLLLLIAIAVGVASYPRCAGGVPLTPEVAARCTDLWPEIELAADLAGLPPATLAALLIEESGCSPIEGWYEDVTGTGQVSWPVWAPLLAAEGWTAADLLDPVWGTLAAGRVLQAVRDRWRLPDWQLLCAYSDGMSALRYRKDCSYSRQVLALARRLERGSGELLATRRGR